jgi:pyridoxamine 5'-phosphate oxidase
MIEQNTSFYNDYDEAFRESWRLLSRGVVDRKSGFHHATVASIGEHGQPRLRTVVLRGCVQADWALRFHTDMRSAKIGEIRKDPRVSLQFYDPAKKIQIRLNGQAVLHHEGDIAEAAWRETRTFSRQCYGILPGPGTLIEAGNNYFLPETTEEATASGRAHFCAVVFEATSFEWLYLASGGHRRASYQKTRDGYQARWLAP